MSASDKKDYHLSDSFSTIVNLYETRPFATCFKSGNHLNGVEFTRISLALGLWLIDAGFSRKNVCILGFNSPLYLCILYGIFYAGCIAAPLNPRWSADDVYAAMDMVSCELLFVDDNMKSQCNCICGGFRKRSRLLTVISFPSTLCEKYLNRQSHFNNEIYFKFKGLQFFCFAHIYESMIEVLIRFIDFERNASMLNLQYPPPLFSDSKCAVICFTSGTTSRPKGVCLSHSNFYYASRAKLDNMEYGANPVHLHIIPLSTVAGLSSAFTITEGHGSHVFIGKFRGCVAVDAIGCNVSSLAAVPAMISDILLSYRSADFFCINHTLRNILIGAGYIPDSLVYELHKIFPDALIYSAYGMTEATSSVTFCNVLKYFSRFEHASSGDESSRAIGYCAESMKIESRDDTGKSLPFDEVGELYIKGDNLMLGYISNTNICRNTFSVDGWYPTGDLGLISSAGEVYLKGRKKDMIKSGGENIFSNEIEDKLASVLSTCKCPTLNVAVVGLPHLRLGEIVCAAIVLRETLGSVVTFFDGQFFVNQIRKGLSSFKQPRLILVKVESASTPHQKQIIQLNSSGKILKVQLRERLISLTNENGCINLPIYPSGSRIVFLSKTNNMYHFQDV